MPQSVRVRFARCGDGGRFSWAGRQDGLVMRYSGRKKRRPSPIAVFAAISAKVQVWFE
ncbi:MAG: hypothetical protein QOI36_6431 [Pseudonocardiales bacterium]|nr:hypothetical protein [Pseudonocardiales bacterium]